MTTGIGIISDLHGDAGGLRLALQHFDAMGITLVICGGDLVDYGPSANETITLLSSSGAVCIRGNHDRWAMSAPLAGVTDPEDDAHVTKLSADSLAYLASLPTCWSASVAGVRIALHHASPGSDSKAIDPLRARAADIKEWLAAADADVLIVGHSHYAFALHGEDGGLVVNPGRLMRSEVATIPGRAFEARTRPSGGGTFAVLELPTRCFRAFDVRDGQPLAIDAWFAHGAQNAQT